MMLCRKCGSVVCYNSECECLALKFLKIGLGTLSFEKFEIVKGKKMISYFFLNIVFHGFLLKIN